VAGDVEAAHQGAGPALRQGGAEGVDGHPRLDHGGVVVHQVNDRPARIEGVAEGAGDLQQEGVAFDQADGAMTVDDGDDESVGFAFEAGEHLASGGLRRHGLGALGENFNGRHTHRHSTATCGPLQGTICRRVKVRRLAAIPPFLLRPSGWCRRPARPGTAHHPLSMRAADRPTAGLS